MLIPGIRELFGDNAKIFINMRNAFENSLINQDFSCFHWGIASKKSLYEKNISILGEEFMNNCVEFKLSEGNEGTIVSPEGTFRVYDYLIRNNKLENQLGKVFYSQEFLRNEPREEVIKGKTISFWQVGFEIYGNNEIETSLLALKTLINCFRSADFDNCYIRISDKRILEGILVDLSLSERRNIYCLIDQCNEDGNTFTACYISKGGNRVIAEKVGQLLNLGKNQELSLDMLTSFANNKLSLKGIAFLKEILNQLKKEYIGTDIRIIPFMPKSWDACDSLLFDVRVPDYNYAVAGGGSLCPLNTKNRVIKRSGAGIGITRLVEYIMKNKQLAR